MGCSALPVTKKQEEIKLVADLIKYISFYEDKDRNLISSLCKEPTAPKSCGNNWLYYKCACRYGWLRYWDGKTFIPITSRPSLDGAYAFVRPLGSEVPNTTSNLAQEYVRMTGKPVVIKNISEEVFVELLNYGFEDYHPSDGWSPSYRYDEENYPEITVNAAHYVSEKKTRNFREKLRKGRKIVLQMEAINTVAHREEMLQILHLWAKNYYSRYPSGGETESSLMHIYLSFAFEIDNQGWLFRAENKAVGFIIEAAGYERSIDLYTAIYDPEYSKKEIAIQMYDMVLHNAAKRNINHVGLGGSEKENLYRFKKYFRPYKESKRYHAVLYPK